MVAPRAARAGAVAHPGRRRHVCSRTCTHWVRPGSPSDRNIRVGGLDVRGDDAIPPAIEDSIASSLRASNWRQAHRGLIFELGGRPWFYDRVASGEWGTRGEPSSQRAHSEGTTSPPPGESASFDFDIYR